MLGWLQWGHGDEAVEDGPMACLSAVDDRRFNGATAMKPWKTCAVTCLGLAVPMLQWGHGDEAVEERSAERGDR